MPQPGRVELLALEQPAATQPGDRGVDLRRAPPARRRVGAERIATPELGEHVHLHRVEPVHRADGEVRVAAVLAQDVTCVDDAGEGVGRPRLGRQTGEQGTGGAVGGVDAPAQALDHGRGLGVDVPEQAAQRGARGVDAHPDEVGERDRGDARLVLGPDEVRREDTERLHGDGGRRRPKRRGALADVGREVVVEAEPRVALGGLGRPDRQARQRLHRVPQRAGRRPVAAGGRVGGTGRSGGAKNRPRIVRSFTGSPRASSRLRSRRCASAGRATRPRPRRRPAPTGRRGRGRPARRATPARTRGRPPPRAGPP